MLSWWQLEIFGWVLLLQSFHDLIVQGERHVGRSSAACRRYGALPAGQDTLDQRANLTVRRGIGMFIENLRQILRHFDQPDSIRRTC